MGAIIRPVTDAVGITTPESEKAAEASKQASQLQAQYQKEALDYLKEKERLPTEIREGALPELAATFGIPGYEGGVDLGLPERGDLVSKAKESELYKALLGGQQAGEEAILRQSAATGGLRSGTSQAALADYATQLQNQALLQSYGEQSRLYGQDLATAQYQQQQHLGGLQALAGLPSYAPQIAQQTSGIGQTLGQGIVGSAQTRAAGQAQQDQNLMALASLGIQGAAMFSDPRLKNNIKLSGVEKGINKYTWDWNEEANNLGLYGSSYGVMADEIEAVFPDAVSIDSGYKKVNYEMLGVSHG